MVLLVVVAHGQTADNGGLQTVDTGAGRTGDTGGSWYCTNDPIGVPIDDVCHLFEFTSSCAPEDVVAGDCYAVEYICRGSVHYYRHDDLPLADDNSGAFTFDVYG